MKNACLGGVRCILLAGAGRAAVAAFPVLMAASAVAQHADSTKTYLADSLLITAVQAGGNAPIAHTNISREELDRRNTGADMPFLLAHTPSVVVTSDAGTGIGYTGIRVRGSDPTRINVTVNGVPINDAESQGMYWVNMPDLASSTDGVQLQRGAGTSTNGPGAFGATLNIQTNALKTNPYGEATLGGGSYNSRRVTARFGTGLIGGHWSFDGRLSRIQSDGYIERSAADLKSYYMAGGYAGNRVNIRFITFSGHEETQQAWGGVPKDMLATNRRYNPYTYDNEIDNYTQTHYQLHTTVQINPHLHYAGALYYTRGYGYFEQYKEDQNLSKYGITPSPADSLYSDLIRRRWLNNHLAGITYSLQYKQDRLDVILGGGASRYWNEHYGEVIWARFAGNSEIRHRYYADTAQKNDFNLYLKATWRPVQGLSLFADVQYRYLYYFFYGLNNNLEYMNQAIVLPFWNPKGGISYQIDRHSQVYASLSVAHREPNRDDFVASTPANRPLPEQMYDYEAGYRYANPKLSVEANFYRMNYHNELVLTGKLNDVGEAIRQNVDRSYRMGLELSAAWKPLKGLTIAGNAALSQNRVLSFREYLDTYDADFNWIGQTEIAHTNTPLAFAPALVAGTQITYEVPVQFGSLSAGWDSRYVGKQYADNTGSAQSLLDAWWVNDLRLGAVWQTRAAGIKTIEANLLVRNLLNEVYESNAWVYAYVYNGNRTADMGYYPQAPANIMGSIHFKF